MTYDELVRGINDRLSEGKYHQDFAGKSGVQLEEINAWTYWQGQGVRHPRILVLGQDWGSLKGSEEYFHAIDDIIAEKDARDSVRYFKFLPGIELGKKEFGTDNKLIEGLKKLGYEDVLHKRYHDLFFTNLIPGYCKADTSTGGFKAAWVTEQVKSDFVNMIKILEPQMVLCLGKNVYMQAAAIYGYRAILKGMKWNDYLDSDPAPLPVNEESGNVSYLFAMPHPGYYGVMNRKKGKKGIDGDWERIGKWMDQNPWNG